MTDKVNFPQTLSEKFAEKGKSQFEANCAFIFHLEELETRRQKRVFEFPGGKKSRKKLRTVVYIVKSHGSTIEYT